MAADIPNHSWSWNIDAADVQQTMKTQISVVYVFLCKIDHEGKSRTWRGFDPVRLSGSFVSLPVQWVH